MTAWMLALIAWLVVFPVLVIAASYLLAAAMRRSQRVASAHVAEVIPLEPARRRRAAMPAPDAAPLRSDHPAPVA